MSTTASVPVTGPIPGDLKKKKRVLLVDTSRTKRELRAEVMRKLGVEVDCAADIPEARCWWKADLYDLVLINVEKEGGDRDRFCEDIRRITPPQKMAFLVGKPGYLADSPNQGQDSVIEKTNEQPPALIAQAADSDDAEVLPRHWGIMEASRRISAVRSASVARTRAMRSLPDPPRDREERLLKRTVVPTSLDNFI
jgi:CheY-like chemotaxis protein